MKLWILSLLALVLSASLHAGSIFAPENGKYVYDIKEITGIMEANHLRYLSLDPRGQTKNLYKLDRKRNEFQVKNWFLQDWFLLQDMFILDERNFINSQKAKTFNQAKRNQYEKFSFSKKHFFHYKTTPAMKEWGGLTHPPIKKLTLPLEAYDKNFYLKDYSDLESAYFKPELQKEVDELSRSELSFGNEVHALADYDVFVKKKELIKKAKDSILMSSLVFVCDKGTREITDLLIKKHREGLDVFVIADGTVGKILGHGECLGMMKRAGIPVIESKDFFKHKLKAIYHTKVLVTDLHEAVAGGHNMIDADNLSRGTDFMNRDVDLYVKGPMVTDIARQFVENWRYQTTLKKVTERPLEQYEGFVREKLQSEREAGKRGEERYAEILENPKTRMKGVCRFIKQSPYEDGVTITKAYLRLLDEVQNHLVITDPIKSDTLTTNVFQKPGSEYWDNFEYFNLLHNKVQSLARKGTKIDYITTNINMAGNENVAMMNERIKEQLERGQKVRANWSLLKLILSNEYYGKPHYENLLNDWIQHKSVHIWTHMSFMHSKIFYFDRILASVGSLNFQHNATDQAYESTAICMDETLNKELDEILVLDMANSIPLVFSRLR